MTKLIQLLMVMLAVVGTQRKLGIIASATSIAIRSSRANTNMQYGNPSTMGTAFSHHTTLQNSLPPRPFAMASWIISSGIQPSYTSVIDSSLMELTHSLTSDTSTSGLSTPYLYSVHSKIPDLSGYLTKVKETSYTQGPGHMLTNTPRIIPLFTNNAASYSANTLRMSVKVTSTSTESTLILPTASFTRTVNIGASSSIRTASSSMSHSQQLGLTSLSPPAPSIAVVHPKCSQNGGCCTKGLNQFPSYVEVEENQTPGTVLVPIFGVEKVAFHLKVLDPADLQGTMEEYFNISRIGINYMFQITKYVDLEDLYLKTNKNNRVNSFQFQITCIDDSPGSFTVPPRTLNLTILDVDDTLPVFQDISGHESCVVPVYTADTSENFVGALQTSPTQIRAVDGDLSQTNVVSYRIMHAEPLDYDVYFELNGTDGTVSKTKTMNSSNPNKYVLFVEAMEESPDQQKRVAILSIKVVPSYVISEDIHEVNPALKLSLEVLSVVVIAGFVSGFVLLLCHRKRVKDGKVEVEEDEIRDYKLPTLAVYESSCSSLNSAESVIKPVASPSAILVAPARPVLRQSPYAAVRSKKFIQRERSPMATTSRPGWNAPKPKIKVIKYNGFTKAQK